MLSQAVCNRLDIFVERDASTRIAPISFAGGIIDPIMRQRDIDRPLIKKGRFLPGQLLIRIM